MTPPPVEGAIDTAGVAVPGRPDAAGADSRSRLDALLDRKWVVRGLVWGGLLAIWQIVAMLKGPAWAPTIPATLEAGVELFSDGYYVTILESLQQMVAGFFLTVLVAVPVGILIGRSRLFEDFFSPWLTTLFSAPKEALLPLLIIVFGTEFEYRVSW
jgi:ABC-type nitrate/sulfonate/bicarbonate transport system permease component